MADLRFWLDMAHRVTLKRNDKLLVGNIDDETPNYIDVSEVLSVLNTDDLPEGTTNKYLTATQKQKLVDLPTNPLTSTEADAAYYPLGSNPSGYLTAASSLSSDKLTGLLSTSLIPDLDAAKIVSGIMNASRIPDLPASKITSGIFDVSRIPNLPMSQITGLGTEFENYISISQKAAANGVAPLDVNTLIPEGYLPGMNADKITDGVLSPDRIPTSFLQTGDLGQPNKVASLDENGYLEIGQLDIDYLDTRYSGGFKQRGVVRVSTVGNITLTGLQTIDGITLVAGDRILVKNQSDASENGIYVVSSGVWTRATDFDEVVPGEVEQGASVFVEEGTTLARTGWILATGGIIDLGVTGLVFTQYAGANNYTGGNLITIDGNQINHDTGSWVAKSTLSGATVISNLSVDAYGHPTNWSTRNLTPANIGAEPSFSKNTAFNKNFGTSSGTVAQGNDSRINNGQTAFSWGNHASAGYLRSNINDSFTAQFLTFNNTSNHGIVTGSDSQRLLIGGGSTWNGNNGAYISLEGNNFGGTGQGANIYLLPGSGGTVSTGTGITVNGGGVFNGNISANIGIFDGSSEAIKIQGAGTGNTNTAYMSFYESNGTTRQGYIGFPSPTNSQLRLQNSVSGYSLIVSDSPTTGNEIQMYNGITTYNVFHGGNHRSDSQNDDRYYTKTQSDANYILRNSRTDGGYAWIRFNSTSTPLNVTQQGSGEIARFYQGSGDGTLKSSIGNDGGISINGGGNVDFYSSGRIRRHSHVSGFLEGSYNTVTANAQYTNPIYTIGGAYVPNEDTLENMYGIGYAQGSAASFLNSTDLGLNPSGWGLYVSAAGTAKVFLDGSNGHGHFAGNVYATAFSGNGGSLTSLNASNITSGTVPSARIPNLPASQITSGTFASARISQASVTQHNSAINAGQVDGKHIWTGSQASYDAIGTKDSNTIYFIT